MGQVASAIGRVLVVEDEGIIARDIGGILRSIHYEVAGFAESASEAIEIALTERPDAVLMDIRIRGNLDGIETARLIRDKVDIPVVYLTAHAEDATLKRARATEPYGYVVKPFTPAAIKAALDIALQLHRAQRQTEQHHAQLTAANESLQQLSRTLVHDLNDAIHSVSMASQLLARQRDLSAVGDTDEYLTGLQLVASAFKAWLHR